MNRPVPTSDAVIGEEIADVVEAACNAAADARIASFDRFDAFYASEEEMDDMREWDREARIRAARAARIASRFGAWSPGPR